MVTSPIEVSARIQYIQEISADYERAYSEEIQLYTDVLETIANGGAGFTARDLAKQALQAKDIDFPRYTA